MPAEVAVISWGKLGISKEEKPLPALPPLLSRARDSEMWRSESLGGRRLAQPMQTRCSLKGKASETGPLWGDTYYTTTGKRKASELRGRCIYAWLAGKQRPPVVVRSRTRWQVTCWT